MATHSSVLAWRIPGTGVRNLYAGQEATARTGQGTTDWFQVGKSSRAAPGKSGFHARGEGERVLALENMERLDSA